MSEISNEDDVKKELRKLEKKIRQIVHLEELGRDLTKEELTKVSYKMRGIV